MNRPSVLLIAASRPAKALRSTCVKFLTPEASQHNDPVWAFSVIMVEYAANPSKSVDLRQRNRVGGCEGVETA